MPAIDAKVVEKLVDNLSGLTLRDCERLTRAAIFNDGALTDDDAAAGATRTTKRGSSSSSSISYLTDHEIRVT
jgi:hypothetical protein